MRESTIRTLVFPGKTLITSRVEDHGCIQIRQVILITGIYQISEPVQGGPRFYYTRVRKPYCLVSERCLSAFLLLLPA